MAGTLILSLIVLVIVVVVAWLLLWKLYQRSSTETALVRTGFLGRKVVIDGGALVVPVLHNVTRVNMNTLCLRVRRADSEALTTKDRLKINVSADFYVRVEASAEGVAKAAQSLGSRSLSQESMTDLLSGKFVNALRAVSAEMTLQELHENRHRYVQNLRDGLQELSLNGLLLEVVSITELDQTDREFFNPNNALDTEGLTLLTREIEQRRRSRNEIEQDAQVAIQRKNLEAEQQTLEIQREEEYARLQQEKEIALRRAVQNSEIAKREAEENRDAEIARIQAQLDTERARVESERQLEEDRIEQQRLLKAKRIDTDNALEVAEIGKRRDQELAEQEREIAIASRSLEQAEAFAKAETARAKTVAAEEQVISARELERAERAKAVELIAATATAEKAAVETVKAAEAAERAAEHQARAVALAAEAETAAERLRSEAAELRHQVEARARQARYDADSSLSDEAKTMRIKLAIIEHLEAIIRESVRPIENIDGIKIIQVDGLTGAAPAAASSDEQGGPANLAEQIFSNALRYRGQAPLVDAILSEVGLNSEAISGLGKPLSATVKPEPD